MDTPDCHVRRYGRNLSNKILKKKLEFVII